MTIIQFNSKFISLLISYFSFLAIQQVVCLVSTSKPNVLFIVADDLGWNDVEWHNNRIHTPNLSYLKSIGIEFNSSYASPVCTPSRASFLSGYYPHRLGLQIGGFIKEKTHALPINVTILPQYLKTLGYQTHAIGKWHLGFCNWNYTPTNRGFDSFLGFYTGQEDYYKKTTAGIKGYDFWYNKDIMRNSSKYSTKIYENHAIRIINSHDIQKPLFLYLAFQTAHTPLQVPEKFEDLYKQIKAPNRRKFSAMVTSMDSSIGAIISALRKRQMFRNTIVLFISDNGAAPYSGGNNYPLRGGKNTVWEGGTRVPTLLASKLFRGVPRIENGLIHAVDWLPTLLDAAGGITIDNIDGLSQWDVVKRRKKSPRNHFVYDISSYRRKFALRLNKYKLISSSACGHYSEVYDVPQTRLEESSLERELKSLARSKRNDQFTDRTYLFDLQNDPSESEDLSNTLPHIVSKIKKLLLSYQEKEVQPIDNKRGKKFHPKFWKGVWTPGWC